MFGRNAELGKVLDEREKKNSISLIVWPVCLERPRECIQDAGFGHFCCVAWMYISNLLSAAVSFSLFSSAMTNRHPVAIFLLYDC